MHVLIVINAVLPAIRYGGTERVAYSLGKALKDLGHRVTFLAREGSTSPFARVIAYDPGRPVAQQVPSDVDVVHFNNAAFTDGLRQPYIVTIHGNGIPAESINPNSVFVSADYARRHGCSTWVHNGLDWDMYPRPDLSRPRRGLHFLGNGAWRVKNLRGAIATARKAHTTLEVMGASRLNIKMGFRFTPYPSIHFHGMVDNRAKAHIISGSRGLLFPVRWHEPFGLAVIESLYYGAPVLATPYGALPELVTDSVGILSCEAAVLADAAVNSDFNPRLCHQYAADNFNARAMAGRYLTLYEKVLNGDTLNPARLPQQAINDRNLPFN